MKNKRTGEGQMLFYMAAGGGVLVGIASGLTASLNNFSAGQSVEVGIVSTILGFFAFIIMIGSGLNERS